MTTRRRRFLWDASLLLLLSIALGGCWSYITKEAQKRFESRQERPSVTVYPVNVVKGATIAHDEVLARKLVAFLRQENLADPVLGTEAIDVPYKWGMNQARMAQQSANAFAARVEKASVETQYALLAEILCNESETEVLGVHYYLSERGGLLAGGGLTNSHWDEFKEVQPRDRNGGYEVLTRMLRKGWKQR